MKIIIHYRHFPMALGRYFDWAFRDLGHEVFSVGCYNGDRIPWGEEYRFPEYDNPPDLVIPEIEAYPMEEVLRLAPWKPDLIIQASDTTYLSGPAPCPNVILATDPHCIDYNPRLTHASHFACMQNNYMQKYSFENKFWVPYAYYEGIHKRLALEPKYDVVFIGLQYEHRKAAIEGMKAKGYKVFSELGHLFDEYNRIYNEGKIAFNWSSLEDTPARFWEGMAMGRCLVTNETPDMALLPFKAYEHYIPFKTVDQAVDAVRWALEDDHYMSIAENGYNAVTTGKNRYQDRCNQILTEVFK